MNKDSMNHIFRIGRVVEQHQWVSPMHVINWLVIVLPPAEEFSPVWRRYHCRWRAAQFRPMLGAQSEGSLSCHTYCETGPCYLIWRTTPFSRFIRLARGSWKPNLTPDPHGCQCACLRHIWFFLSWFPLKMPPPHINPIGLQVLYLLIRCEPVWILADICWIIFQYQ
jgi:hypothetical protein